MNVRVLLGTAISLGFLYLLFSSVDLAALRTALVEIELWVLGPAVALYFCGLWCRAMRWRLLLGTVRLLPTPFLFRTLVIGLAVNDLLPLRLGELARAEILRRKNQLAFGSGLASIVVERILDGLTLCLVLVTALLVSSPSVASDWLAPLSYVATSVFLLALSAVGLAIVRPELGHWFAGRLAHLLPPSIGGAVVRLVASALVGFTAVSQPRLIVPSLALSIAAWSFEIGMFYVILLGVPATASVVAAALGASAANLSSMVPSAPGYLGTFDWPLQQVLVQIYGLPSATATSYTLLVHATLVFPVVLLGLVFLWRADLSLRQLSQVQFSRSRASEVAAAARLSAPEG